MFSKQFFTADKQTCVNLSTDQSYVVIYAAELTLHFCLRITQKYLHKRYRRLLYSKPWNDVMRGGGVLGEAPP